jgi:beta-barrel assembly-enhancing protease
MTRTTNYLSRQSAAVAAALVLTFGVASAQTPVTPPRNSFEPAEDVQIGQEAASQVRQELPMLNDRPTDEMAERIGQRLIANIPAALRQPAFRYSFDVVNLREINAFALPGGPTFLHRGMIEAARTEGEVAGVMAHELSHVILRHGTAQATKGQKAQIGAIAGQILGAIIGGREGAYIAQGSELLAGGFMLKYSRDYERQADLLGAQLMAQSGYDPRQMASMFETIARQGGNRGPEWLSSHPDPGNRSEAITREAELLQVRGNAGSREDFQSVKSRLAQMPPAPTMEQVERGQVAQGTPRPTGTSGRAGRVEPPSSEWSTYQAGGVVQLSVPSNWREMSGANGSVTYAPEGGYTQGAFTHGVQVGVAQLDGSSDLEEATEQLLESFAQSNPELRRQGNYARTNIGGRRGLTATLSNVSATGEAESVMLSTAPLDENGRVLFIVGVAPQSEARTYQNTFGRVLQSVKISGNR